MKWSEVSSLYQIYPRSFQDLSGDGVGDLNGITFRLDYLQDLGVDAIWISPFFTSPMRDFGYDIADYRSVDPTFGTLDDFRMLLDEAHARDMKVMIDLVPCHTSDEHPWFKEARASRNNPKRDYYVWHDPVDEREPNNWRSLAGGRSWTFDDRTGQYYLHSFLSAQPDLNWDNPAVRHEMKEIVRFWFNMGVDGMRVDAIWGISKDPELRDDALNHHFSGDTESYGAYIHNRCKHGPNFTAYLHELADVCREYDDRQMVFEFYPDEQLGDIWRQYAEVIQSHSHTSAFFMEHRHDRWHGAETGQQLARYLEAAGGNVPFFCVGNHDQPRITSRLGAERARTLQFLNLLCPGVSVLYYGDEIGMENGQLNPGDIQDRFSPNHTPTDSRDRARTPMQWDGARYAGFTNVQPWLPVHANRRQVNVATELQDPGSLLLLHRRLLYLRRKLPIIRKGTLTVIETGNGYVLGIERRLDEHTAYIFVNFADAEQVIIPPRYGEIPIATHDNAARWQGDQLLLNGYGAALIVP